jgi:hypothetical protein
MNFPIYVIGQLVIVLLIVGVVSSIYVALSKVFQQMKLSRIDREKRLHLILSFLFAWLLLLLLLSPSIQDWLPIGSGTLMSILFFTATVLLIIISFARIFNKALRIIDGRWLVRIQGLRIVTELLFWLGFKAGFVPIQMTFSWLNYDIIVGLSALIASQVFFMRRVRKTELFVWNLFGIVSISYLIFIAIASLPDASLQLFRSAVSSEFLMQAPFIWLLGFIYPFFILMHICSLRQLFFINAQAAPAFSPFPNRLK